MTGNIVLMDGLKPCLLCGHPTWERGAFLPPAERADEFGTPPGKRRMIVYPAHVRCFELVGDRGRELIERELRAEVAGNRVQPLLVPSGWRVEFGDGTR